jgi:hypothetical protein
MDTQIIVVFCLCADMLKSLHHYEDRQCRMSDAEVMTTAIIAMLYFKGNFCLASQYLYEQGYIPNMLSRSRFNRRLHRIADLFLTLFLRLGETWKKLNEKSVYVIDSYPIAVCDNYRIKRSKIYHGEDFRGYIASKKRYFYGLRIHILVTEQGEPVEFFLEPGAFSDTRALGLYNFDLPEHSLIRGSVHFILVWFLLRTRCASRRDGGKSIIAEEKVTPIRGMIVIPLALGFEDHPVTIHLRECVEDLRAEDSRASHHSKRLPGLESR